MHVLLLVLPAAAAHTDERIGIVPAQDQCIIVGQPTLNCGKSAADVSEVPCIDGPRSAREKNLTLPRNVRVQPCIRPLNVAVLAAGPDVIH